MLELDEDECFDIFPVFCVANIPVEVSLYGPLHPGELLTKYTGSQRLSYKRPQTRRMTIGTLQDHFTLSDQRQKIPHQDDPAKSAAGIDVLTWNKHMCCGFC
jgi:hypothetical protein